MNPRTFASPFAPNHPLRAPENDQGGGDVVDPAFVEQPGDRTDDGKPPVEPEPEPEPTAEEPPAEEEPPEAAAEGAEGDEGEAEGDEPPAEEEPPAKPKTNWKDRQIIKLRQQLKQKDEALAKVATPPAEPKEPQVGPDGEELVPRSVAEAAALAKFQQQQRVQNINQAADAMFDAGAAAYPKTWETRINEAAEALRDEIIAKPEFLETITDLPNAAAVYHELAGDLDRMEAVLAMPPHKMGLELATISAKLSAKPAAPPKPVSKAPAPIKPLDKPAQEDLALDDPRISQEEFNRRMDKIERERMESGRR